MRISDWSSDVCSSDLLLAQGAGYYAESCAYCHGGPGQEPAEWSRGMRPEPPHLTEAATEWTDQEIHWIVSNGFKMTGMPAFSEHNSPEEIVAIATFVRALPGLSVDDYSRLTGFALGESQSEPPAQAAEPRLEEHTSELTSLMCCSYAVIRLK